MLDKKLKQEIVKKFKGKGGPPDCESSIIESKDERICRNIRNGVFGS
jgi:hypothetical protein